MIRQLILAARMRSNFTQLYLHCVWATWDRLPLITPEIHSQIYGVIIHECEELGCTVIAIGGIADHVHLLVNIPPTLNATTLLKRIKGSSSHAVTHQIQPNSFFKWQGGYGAFTVSYCELDRVANYIRNQAQHHHKSSIVPSFEPFSNLS